MFPGSDGLRMSAEEFHMDMAASAFEAVYGRLDPTNILARDPNFSLANFRSTRPATTPDGTHQDAATVPSGRGGIESNAAERNKLEQLFKDNLTRKGSLIWAVCVTAFDMCSAGFWDTNKVVEARSLKDVHEPSRDTGNQHVIEARLRHYLNTHRRTPAFPTDSDSSDLPKSFGSLVLGRDPLAKYEDEDGDSDVDLNSLGIDPDTRSTPSAE